MAAAPGNQYGARARVWRAAIERALNKRSLEARRDALDDIAEKLLNAAETGDIAALKELGDRLDGKPVQGIAGPDGGPARILFGWMTAPPSES